MTPKGWRYREHPHGYRLSVRSDYTTTSIWLDYKTTLLHDSHIPTISRLYLGDCKGCFLWGGESESTCDRTRLHRTNLFHNSVTLVALWSTLTPVHTWICLENRVYCLFWATRPSLSIGLLVFYLLLDLGIFSCALKCGNCLFLSHQLKSLKDFRTQDNGWSLLGSLKTVSARVDTDSHESQQLKMSVSLSWNSPWDSTMQKIMLMFIFWRLVGVIVAMESVLKTWVGR